MEIHLVAVSLGYVREGLQRTGIENEPERGRGRLMLTTDHLSLPVLGPSAPSLYLEDGCKTGPLVGGWPEIRSLVRVLDRGMSHHQSASALPVPQALNISPSVLRELVQLTE